MKRKLKKFSDVITAILVAVILSVIIKNPWFFITVFIIYIMIQESRENAN